MYSDFKQLENMLRGNFKLLLNSMEVDEANRLELLERFNEIGKEVVTKLEGISKEMFEGEQLTNLHGLYAMFMMIQHLRLLEEELDYAAKKYGVSKDVVFNEMEIEMINRVKRNGKANNTK